MSAIILEIILVFLLVLLNGFLSMSETALVSSRRTRFQQLADEGDERARTALHLVENPPRFLSTVQAGITLVGIIMGAFGGTTIAEQLAGVIARVPWLVPYAQALGFTIVVLVITFFSIVLGELVPKQIALINPERIALAVAGAMRFLAAVLRPLVFILSASSTGLLRLFGASGARPQPVSEEEIKVMIDQGIEHGMFEEAERDMIEGVFDLGDRLLVVTTPYDPSNQMIVTAARDQNPELMIISRAATVEGLEVLAQGGAQVVIQPELEGGLHLLRHTLLELGFPLEEVHKYAEAVRADPEVRRVYLGDAA